MIAFIKSIIRVMVVLAGVKNLLGNRKISSFDLISIFVISGLSFAISLIDPQMEGIVVIPLIAAYAYKYSKNILKSILIAIGTMLIVILSEFLVKLIIQLIFDLKISVFELGDDNFLVFFTMSIPILFFVSIFTKIIYLVTNKYDRANHRIKLFEILAVFLSLAVFIVTLSGIKVIMMKDDLLSFGIYFICYLALAITLIVLYKSAKKDMMVKLKEEEQKNLKYYTQELEVLCDELHRIMHENNNIMLTMAHYIETNNMPQLEEYFSDKIMEYKKRHVIDEKNLLALSNISQPEIKSLIYCKLIEANEKNLSPILDVHENMIITEADTIDLSSMLGILIDNAIQGAEKCKEPVLRIGLITKDTSKMIIVQNSCPGDMPSLQQLFGEKASTKNKTGKGHGLSNLKQIIEKYPDFYLETEIQDGMITQCIVIS